LKIKNEKNRVTRIKLLYDIGLIQDDVISIDSFIFKSNKQRGYLDARNARGILGAIKEFYLVAKRLPNNLKELSDALNIQRSIDYFNGSIHYRRTEEKNFILRFYGADGILFTSDDKPFNFSNLKIN
jgi:hypothetical protein